MSRGLFERLLHKHSAPVEQEEEIESSLHKVEPDAIAEEDLDLNEENLSQLESSDFAEHESAQDSDVEVTEEQKKGNAMSALLASDAAPELKKRALRSLFLSGQFSEVDELNDYNQDFSQMKSLSADVASKLRHWTHEKVEQLEELAEEMSPTDESQLLAHEAQTKEIEAQESDADIKSVESQSVDKKETYSSKENNSDEAELLDFREDSNKNV
ncbi:hypothetical protein VIN01S_07970 [Vibrio inusitatus NBRC 102082]|uniref:DUF3306 domain-containing protein n=1 Tax=Vibrio inusitatus NBRC 102082 TaxID=1219070 RepID=A0A4Y3HS68_9VIBR|nr:DUF3306 domain-containing protein [Vibrio inusitatus]GEA49993.1 hypothetical protein VIN01S_07970 [Vibrio inusitatus NBRC 102082]